MMKTKKEKCFLSVLLTLSVVLAGGFFQPREDGTGSLSVSEDIGWVIDDDVIHGVIKVSNSSGKPIKLCNIVGDGGSTVAWSLISAPQLLVPHGKSTFIEYSSNIIRSKYNNKREAFIGNLENNKAGALSPAIPVRTKPGSADCSSFSARHSLKKQDIRDYPIQEYPMLKKIDSAGVYSGIKDLKVEHTNAYGFYVTQYGDSIHIIEGFVTLTNAAPHALKISSIESVKGDELVLWNNGKKATQFNDYALIPPGKTVVLKYNSDAIDRIYHHSKESFIQSGHAIKCTVRFLNSTEVLPIAINLTKADLNQVINR